MEILEGKSIFKQIAIGKIMVYKKRKAVIRETKSENPVGEMNRYLRAKEKAVHQLHLLSQTVCSEIGKEKAQIFEVYAMLLEDGGYNASIKEMILEKGLYAENAVAQTEKKFVCMFEKMDDSYLKERAADIRDVSQRVIDILCKSKNMEELEEPVILAAEELSPSETVQMDKKKLLAFITECGTENSHTSILARTIGIPAVSGIKINPQWNGKMAIVDGFTGKLYIDPDKEVMLEMQKKYDTAQKQHRILEQLKGKPDETKSGKKIKLYANIGNIADVENVILNDAAGIGLFRSEFLYLQQDHLPTEEEQFLAYKSVVERMNGKKVIIRTMDIGADKRAEYFHLKKEENPAMGYRAIRICLTQTEIFRTQLRAILRAAQFGTVAIMYPMIISLEEVKKIKSIMQEVQKELQKKNILFGKLEQGIMIETPAAALMSEELAKEVDFFSIGTNDLTQYTLALDRQNAQVNVFYDAYHPAVMKLIEMTVKNAHANHCRVGICGELGADLTMTETFIQMGVDELSVSPGMILPIRKKIREIS